VTNPWYPLKPGSRYVYRGVKNGETSREVMTVTHRTRVIDGAPCVAVSDRLYLSGKLEERTTDYYTQDAKGNVWYFGEDTAELDKQGNVKTTEGSWLAGANGARPGIFMYAVPKAGQSARQEFLEGQAEDHFQVLRLGVGVHVPYGSSQHALLTKEWTPLEPGASEFFTFGLTVSPFSTAFLASRPAASITLGLEVFVHDVIAEITTDPSPRWLPLPAPAPNASVKERLTCGSDTRSCGRRGPASDGSTTARSISMTAA